MKEILIITKEDERYPKNLLNIKNSPEKLYALGDYKLLNKKSIAIIGSRKCTEYGSNQAIKFAKELSKNDLCIVSGMAIGIDTSAHLGAKKETGRTIAVLGSGFHNIYPEENIQLFNEILDDGGCIISEYSPDTKVQSKNFPIRNRIISGLSNGVLVVEATEKSGSTITARLAREQNKTIYCIPGNIGNKHSIGTRKINSKRCKNCFRCK